MAWDSVDSNKATEKQIKYAESLLEAYYGDINFPIYIMSKQDISTLIEDVKKKCNEKKIHLNGNTEEVQRGEMVEGRLMPYTGYGITQMNFDEYAFGRVRGSIPAHKHRIGSAIDVMQYAEGEATRRRGEE